tara:strand:+ start:2184 stop:3437 length:1254 start_codon:yes stop_codon:yes gene_type:complete
MEMTSRAGFVYEELFNWHRAGDLHCGQPLVEPLESWENEATKRRFANLLAVTGLIRKLDHIRARHATKEEILRFHTEAYHNKIESDSKKPLGGNGGEEALFAFGAYEIATMSAGGVLAAVEAIMEGRFKRAYCLVRPPGHHAERDTGMGFCIFNNIVLAAMHLRKKYETVKKIAIVDYDVHHGNGTQQAFRDDPSVLFVSLHQDNNYPQGNSGNIEERGSDTAMDAEGHYTTINVPLPPGSGRGAYRHAFQNLVLPAVERFEPDFILVSSGFDAEYSDCLAAMMLSSDDYHYFATKLCSVCDSLPRCHGICFSHEGGYSKDYVPFCGAAVIEALLDTAPAQRVADPYLNEVRNWGYQGLQPHQRAVVDRARLLHGLMSQEEFIRAQFKSMVVDSFLQLPGVDPQVLRDQFFDYEFSA